MASILLTWHVVVCQSCDVKLQHLQVLRNNVRCRASLLVTQQLVIGLQNVGQLVSKIVLEIITRYEI